jgi:hypothetical protein
VSRFIVNPENMAKLEAFWAENGYNIAKEKVYEFCRTKGIAEGSYYAYRKARMREEGIITEEDEEREAYEEFIKELRKASQGGKNANYARLYAQIKGYLGNKEKKSELNAEEIYGYVREIKRILKDEYESSGSCPVCGFSKAVHGALQDTGSVEPEDSVMESLGLPE